MGIFVDLINFSLRRGVVRHLWNYIINRSGIQMQFTPELLRKYLSGSCTDEEKSVVEKWLSSEDLEESYPAAEAEEESQEAVWKRLRFSEKPSADIVAKSRWLWLSGVAASVILVIAGGFLLFKTAGVTIPSQTSGSTEKRFITIESPDGHRKELRLPDGTMVYLNSGSQLRYPETFDKETRTVQFSGEAYFEVSKDSLHPFIILTENTQTKVLGTEFNLRAYPSEKRTEVVVTEGRVKFSARTDEKQAVLLTASEQGSYIRGRSPVERTVYVNRYLGWRENKLIFSDQKLSEIIPELERWYGVKVEVKSEELLSLRYTGTFRNVTLSNLIQSMSYALDFKYQLTNKTLSIY